MEKRFGSLFELVMEVANKSVKIGWFLHMKGVTLSYMFLSVDMLFFRPYLHQI